MERKGVAIYIKEISMIGIYKITNPKGRIYIGQSTDIDRRRSSYTNRIIKGQPRLSRSVAKYGFSEHIFEVVEECEVGLLNVRERHWQDFYNVLSKAGLNCILQGSEEKRVVYSDELLKQRSESAKRPRTEEQKVKLSELHKGKRLSQETKELISRANVGKVLSEVTRKKMSESKKGKPLSDATKEKRAASIAKRWDGARTLSEEHRKKLSDAAKNRWKNKL